MKESLDAAIATTGSHTAGKPQHRHPPRDLEHRQDNLVQLPYRGHPEFTGQAAEQQSAGEYEEQRREREPHQFTRRAQKLGYTLAPPSAPAALPAA